jgi:hypothetical protein
VFDLGLSVHKPDKPNNSTQTEYLFPGIDTDCTAQPTGRGIVQSMLPILVASPTGQSGRTDGWAWPDIPTFIPSATFHPLSNFKRNSLIPVKLNHHASFASPLPSSSDRQPPPPINAQTLPPLCEASGLKTKYLPSRFMHMGRCSSKPTKHGNEYEMAKPGRTNQCAENAGLKYKA